MFPKNEIKSYTLGSGKLKAYILESGNLKEIRNNNIRINTYVGNNLEETINNLYIKIDSNSNSNCYKRLIGIGSNSVFSIDNDCAYYKGSFNSIEYSVLLKVFNDTIIYQVKTLKNDLNLKFSIYYGMDVSISDIGGINSNEAYISQYVDHKAFKTDLGYVVCSRQNQGTPHYLEQGSLTKNISYSTDGFQFFTNEYKYNSINGKKQIKALINDRLDNEVYQYEFGYCALQSELLSTNIDNEVVFYLTYSDDHYDAISTPLYLEKVKSYYNELESKELTSYNKKIEHKISFSNVLEYNKLTNDEIDELYPNKYLSEIVENKLLSFFTDNKSHVVLPEKELLTERPSGNILLSLKKSNNDYDFEHILASTTYIFGVFNSQIVYGNTSFNKLMSNIRNPLNIQKITGQRIFIKINDEYKLLDMPGIYEMGLNYAKWYYKIEDNNDDISDIIEIKSMISTNYEALSLQFNSKLNKKYDILITNHLTMGQTENENKVHVVKDNNNILCYFDESSLTYSKCPKYHFLLNLDQDYELYDDSIFYIDNESRNDNFVNLKLTTSNFELTINGKTENNNELIKVYKNEDSIYLNKLKEITNNFNLKLNSSNTQLKDNIESYNYLIYWLAHDALVHFLSPHGLEQYNGAAWGTRDVCQGPAEFFLSLHKLDEVRKILINVYSHQFLQTGDFPQWFMFDKYSFIQDLSSHGDIIVWPLRLLGLYLKATKDFSILSEKVPYMDKTTADYTKEKFTIYEHVKKELATIESHFIENTFLSCYGGGDWDDTLQPANQEYKKEMVSGWTVELTYEMYKILSEVLFEYDQDFAKHLDEVAKNIYNDYHKIIIKDDIPAGFIHITKDHIKYIIHPKDNETTLKYRLLPLTRGIISNMLTPKQKALALNIIDENLKYPDGVRLMDKSIKYRGGVKTYFSRAETASNFGREIGLQYCHAHIRYCEALQKMEKNDQLFNELLKINPVVVTNVCKNALPRQRNSYYSSSDGAYLNRYDVMENYHLLKEGKIGVKGGWRVYSSGPGIYIHTIIEGLLGIKLIDNQVVIKPIIDKALDGLKFTTKLYNKDVEINYHIGNIQKIKIDNKEIKLDKVIFNDTFEGYILKQELITNSNITIIDIYL